MEQHQTDRRTPQPCVEALDGGTLAAVWLDAFTDERVDDHRTRILDEQEWRS